MNISPTSIEIGKMAVAERLPETGSASPHPAAAPAESQIAAAVKAPQETAKTDAAQRNSVEETAEAVEKIARFVGHTASDLQFTVDEESDIPVVKVIDRATKEVIRQIPSQEAIEISKALDRLDGLLVRNSA